MLKDYGIYCFSLLFPALGVFNIKEVENDYVDFLRYVKSKRSNDNSWYWMIQNDTMI